ncbi:hypothetical protein OROHE_024066 [Orobanche hederae]
MAGSGSPCGACKFLRRKCVRGCVFAPYFSYEQGTTHFAAIHKVFGASNVSKILSHLPIADRRDAAVTIAYEAQARVQDPIYGCVSHIFALQQQVVYLQAQLASLREQAPPQYSINNPSCGNPNNHGFHGENLDSLTHDVQTWLHQVPMCQYDANKNNIENGPYFSEYGTMSNSNPNTMRYEENPDFQEENNTFSSMDLLEELQSSNYNRQWQFQDDSDDLQSLALRYFQNS